MKRKLYILIALPMALLAACSGTTVLTPVDLEARASEARQASESGDPARARELYSTLVARTTGTERSRFQIELARSEYQLGENEAALASLDAISLPLPPPLDAERAAVRASIYFDLGRAAEAVRLLVEREIWLDSSAEIGANQNMIWEGLSLPQSRRFADVTTGDPIVDGWLALAPLTSLTSDGDAFYDGLIDWQSEFGNHPAASGILAERLAVLRPTGVRPGRIALLLPLGSDVRPEALSVRDGIFAAHYASGRSATTTISVYDTAQRGSVETMEAALRDGADVIVGPLLPFEVEAVQAGAGFIPVLALNTGSDTAPVASNFFRFALSSDDEVEAIAARAIAEGHRTAVILHTGDERGRRVRNGFRDAFEARGGVVINTAAYFPDDQSFESPIKALLNISQSEQRRQRLRDDLAGLGLTIEFEPRRREDIDMIFLQAEPGDGRLLVPLLEQNLAEDVPTYATSDVYDPTRAGGDPDLDRLIFTDLPLLIDPASGGRQASELLESFSSEATTRFPRFFAFGFDAYQVATALYDQAATVPGWRLSGATGVLYLDADGRVRRILPFAEFDGGRPRPAELPLSLSDLR